MPGLYLPFELRVTILNTVCRSSSAEAGLAGASSAEEGEVSAVS